MATKTGQKSNIALLTEGQGYIQRAKKARREQIEEIKFDDSARSEWLTGFSKRKKAKVEGKRARAKERDHQAHLDEKRKARQELRERAAQNVKSFREAMGLPELDPADADSIAESDLEDDEEQYSDDDQLATVTITEDFDPSTSLPIASSSQTRARPLAAIPELPPSSKRAQTREKNAKLKKKVEKEKSRGMETKAERKMGRALEGRNRAKKAGLAMERDGKVRGGKRVGSRGGRGGRGGSRGGASRGRGGKK